MVAVCNYLLGKSTRKCALSSCTTIIEKCKNEIGDAFHSLERCTGTSPALEILQTFLRHKSCKALGKGTFNSVHIFKARRMFLNYSFISTVIKCNKILMIKQKISSNLKDVFAEQSLVVPSSFFEIWTIVSLCKSCKWCNTTIKH